MEVYAMKMNYKIVKVSWYDAEEIGEVGWNSLSCQKKTAKKPPPRMESVGFLVYECETHVSLLSTIGTKESSTLEKIPRGMILGMVELAERVDSEQKNE
jgi:hypothetical protein